MKDFWIHLGAQVGMAAAGAAVTSVAGADYTGLGVWAGVAQAFAAITAEVFNQLGKRSRAAAPSKV